MPPVSASPRASNGFDASGEWFEVGSGGSFLSTNSLCDNSIQLSICNFQHFEKRFNFDGKKIYVNS
jgi:hypothetical protein